MYESLFFLWSESARSYIDRDIMINDANNNIWDLAVMIHMEQI